MHMPGKPSGPISRCAAPHSANATARRAASASGAGDSSARELWPPRPPMAASIHKMPRWRVPARHEVGSQTMARRTSASASRSRSRSARMTVPLRSSSPEKTTARSRGGAPPSSAARIAAIAPLVSQAPSPTTRPSPTRARNGSPRPARVHRHGVDVRVDEQPRRAPGGDRVGADDAVARHVTTRTRRRARAAPRRAAHRRGSSPPGLCVSTAMSAHSWTTSSSRILAQARISRPVACSTCSLDSAATR